MHTHVSQGTRRPSWATGHGRDPSGPGSPEYSKHPRALPWSRPRRSPAQQTVTEHLAPGASGAGPGGRGPLEGLPPSRPGELWTAEAWAPWTTSRIKARGHCPLGRAGQSLWAGAGAAPPPGRPCAGAAAPPRALMTEEVLVPSQRLGAEAWLPSVIEILLSENTAVLISPRSRAGLIRAFPEESFTLRFSPRTGAENGRFSCQALTARRPRPGARPRGAGGMGRRGTHTRCPSLRQRRLRGPRARPGTSDGGPRGGERRPPAWSSWVWGGRWAQSEPAGTPGRTCGPPVPSVLTDAPGSLWVSLPPPELVLLARGVRGAPAAGRRVISTFTERRRFTRGGRLPSLAGPPLRFLLGLSEDPLSLPSQPGRWPPRGQDAGPRRIPLAEGEQSAARPPGKPGSDHRATSVRRSSPRLCGPRGSSHAVPAVPGGRGGGHTAGGRSLTRTREAAGHERPSRESRESPGVSGPPVPPETRSVRGRRAGGRSDGTHGGRGRGSERGDGKWWCRHTAPWPGRPCSEDPARPHWARAEPCLSATPRPRPGLPTRRFPAQGRAWSRRPTECGNDSRTQRRAEGTGDGLAWPSHPPSLQESIPSWTAMPAK